MSWYLSGWEKGQAYSSVESNAITSMNTANWDWIHWMPIEYYFFFSKKNGNIFWI